MDYWENCKFVLIVVVSKNDQKHVRSKTIVATTKRFFEQDHHNFKVETI